MYPHPGNLDWITSYGLVLVIALAACWWLARRRARKAGIDPSHIDLLLPAAICAGLAIGLLRPEPRVQLIPLILICLCVVFVYSRLARQPFARLADVLALPTIAAIAIQRIGCFLAGCCWGNPVARDELQWIGVQFPAGSFAHEQHVALGLIGPGAAASLPVHATQLYEAILLAAMLLLLRSYDRGRHAPGSLTLAAITGYAVIRFGIEVLRADNFPVFWALTAVQALCLGIIAACALQAWRIRVYS